jgi:hypothetical protein
VFTVTISSGASKAPIVVDSDSDTDSMEDEEKGEDAHKLRKLVHAASQWKSVGTTLGEEDLRRLSSRKRSEE